MRQQNQPRIRTNVLAIRTEEDGRRSDRDFASHLWYWDLLELTRKIPMKFPSAWAREENLTDRQRAEKDGFIRPATEHAMHLWKDMPAVFRPMPMTRDEPWFNALVQREPLALLAQDLVKPSIDDVTKTSDNILRTAMDGDEVLNASPEARILVMAPPGTGKTHLMLDRLERLVDHPNINNPYRDIMVLSFTRATVSEIIWRIKGRVEQGAADDMRYINVRTFDSLVTRLLLLDKEADTLPDGYTSRISWFLKMLEINQIPRAMEELTAIHCLMVDELQDLSGIRAELVLRLAKIVMNNGGGVVFLGDPAQAIYDFDRNDGMSGHQFISQFIHLADHELITWPLETYFRFRNPALEDLAHQLRQFFGKDGLGEPSIDVLPKIWEAVPLKPLAWLLDTARDRKVAVLVHDNLEVYQLAQWAFESDVRVEVKPRRNYWPAWMARLVWGIPGASLPKDQLKRLWDMRVAERVSESWDDAMELLSSEGVLRGETLNLAALGELVREQAPRSIERPGLFVTTIHQAKGLEYDSVAILEPKKRNLSGDPEEVRKMYVAATRARDELLILARENKVFDFGKKDPYHHFHRYIRAENGFLLNGLPELSCSQLWHCPPNMSLGSWKERVTSLHNSWWEEFWGFPRELKLPWNLSSHNTENLLQVSATLQSDLELLARKYSLYPSGHIMLPVVDLVSVAAPVFSEIAGTANLFLIPWVFGWSRVQLQEV